MKKAMLYFVTLCMICNLCACSAGGTAEPAGSAEPAESGASAGPAASAEPAGSGEKMTYEELSDLIFDENLGEYAAAYEAAAAVTDDQTKRFGLMAAAEAKLLEAGVFLPLYSNGGSYAISREAPYSRSTTLWSVDQYRYGTALVSENMPVTAADRKAMTEKYAELRGTGTYYEWARAYMEEHGYELADHYGVLRPTTPVSWDIFSSDNVESHFFANIADTLLQYDCEGELQPMLASDYSVSEDGMTYTFRLREDAKWYDQQGREIAGVTADDFVCGLQHLLDCRSGWEYLVGPAGAKIKNVDAYLDGTVTDFAEVGVQAVDDYTLVYTLEEPNPSFLSMIPTFAFFPVNRAYYVSQGGGFGQEFDSSSPSYLYGTDYEHIASCGPYVISSFAEGSAAVYRANPDYYNADRITVQRFDMLFSDESDVLQKYRAVKAGEATEIQMISPEQIEAAREDGWLEEYGYISNTDGNCFGLFVNLNRAVFANINDATKAVSPQTQEDRERTAPYMRNVHFRQALLQSIDRGAYYEQKVGEELKYAAVTNGIVPGRFVSLDEDLEMEIGGESVTFPAGTCYGAIVQAQLEADGSPIRVWDQEADSGIGLSSGFDGWYDPENAAAELEQAIEEVGIEVTAENPVYVDLPNFTGSPAYDNQSHVIKQSIEEALGGRVIVNLLSVDTREDWYSCGLFSESGKETNYNIYDMSSLDPYFGDPETYLGNFYRSQGSVTYFLGIY